MASSNVALAAAAAAPLDPYTDKGVPGVDALQAEKRYGEERTKRIRDEGNGQFIDIPMSDRFYHFMDDPWVDMAAVRDLESMFPTNRCQLLILGAGFGGLLYAIHMMQAGVKLDDIRIVDTAGGFGGTWYWNRYPGLSCDIESYCYLPLLEETGYTPRHRYSSGEEIREYAGLVARKYNLADKAVFRTKAEKLEWDDATKEWQIDLAQDLDEPHEMQVRSRFVATVNGVLNWPKLPFIPGIQDFGGCMFHSSRWDYSYTGGSPSDLFLDKLGDKSVALVGTGCSGVQIAPHLAAYAKRLYVVQRTPASVDIRDQRTTDADWFRTNVAATKGWQRERMRNFHQHLTTGELPETNLVDDEFSRARGMVTVGGNPNGIKSLDELPGYVQHLLNDIDLPRQNRIRHRVTQTVKDAETAKKLQAWYPTWCKRPAFSNEYLPTFNRENVTLLDTDGKGLEAITSGSIIVDGVSYAVDAIVFATGYRAPFVGTPAEKANIRIFGCGGVSMSKEWAQNGPSTLHGILDSNFPNLFLSGPWQASISPNNLFNTGQLAKHAAYIVGKCLNKADAVEIAPTSQAVADWGNQVLMHSIPSAAGAGCTPNYFNVEGELDRVPPEAQMQVARSGLWGFGIEDFVSQLEAWREDSSMPGVSVRC